MNKIHMPLLLTLILTLTACQHDDVSVNDRSVVLHPPGTPSATIDPDGHFSVDRKKIQLSSSQQAQLRQYHDAVMEVHRERDAIKNQGKAMAREGLSLAGKQLHNALARSGSSAKPTEKTAREMQTQAEGMAKSAHTLCRKVQKLNAGQALLAEQISAFKPYANINAAPGVNCGS